MAELLLLATLAWVLSIMIQIDPVGVQVNRWGLKWLVYTYAVATIPSVIIPFAILFSASACIAFFVKAKPYRTAYRFAFVLVTIWTVCGNYGHWYGKCRNEDGHSAGYCGSFGVAHD